MPLSPLPFGRSDGTPDPPTLLIRVLWVDSAPTPALWDLADALHRAHVLMDVTKDRASTRKRAGMYEYDLIVFDARAESGDRDDEEWLVEVVQQSPQVPVAIGSVAATYLGTVAAVKVGAFAQVETPQTVEAVLALVCQAKEWQAARRAGAGRVG